ncbi:MAG: ABC transporter ATP-binding protein [Nitrososphaerota archaeon]|nr:ABC transporter ATP-binding protein [Candidatus Bathyarchaeota archaeon]MDW8049055.1 ABC transporter ATP-binding protein [Nitrososphaerota archaeon]
MYYRTRMGPLRAVDGISFNVERGESIALIGESGCGKTSLAKSLIRLLPRNVELYKGSICLDGVDIMTLDDAEFRRTIQWQRISMVSQAAMNSLNPVIKVGEQVAEPLIVHKEMDKRSAMERAREIFSLVGIPEIFIDRYPFELSGGMRQRVVIAMALVMNPEIIILDEPTSALDVLTQANIMNLLKKIRRESKINYVLITHDVGLSSELADKVAVMYAGQIVEFSDADRFYASPLHPYSQKLMASVPTLRQDKMPQFILGVPISLINPPTGCRFAERCPSRMEKCREDPPLNELGKGMFVKCWLYSGQGKESSG